MKTKTYAESRGERPFNWNWFLRRVRFGLVTQRQIDKADVLARQWVTCACGNLCERLPRYDSTHGPGRPRDDILFDLGLTFLQNVLDRDWAKATATLRRIEARSAVLLAEMAAQ